MAGRYVLLGSTIAATISTSSLIASAADIAEGRDREAFTKLGLAGAQAVAALLVALSGAEAAKAVAEAFSIVKDGLETAKLVK